MITKTKTISNKTGATIPAQTKLTDANQNLIRINPKPDTTIASTTNKKNEVKLIYIVVILILIILGITIKFLS